MRYRVRLAGPLAFSIGSLCGAVSAQQPCVGWSVHSGLPGLGDSGAIHDSVLYNAGNGEKLVVAGTFSEIEGVAAAGLAVWNGTTWEPFPVALPTSGFPGAYALAVREQGAVDGLYVSISPVDNDFSTNARTVVYWDGAAWTVLPSTVTFASPTQMVVHEDVLYAATNGRGQFGGVETDYYARWDGTAWGGQVGSFIVHPAAAMATDPLTGAVDGGIR